VRSLRRCICAVDEAAQRCCLSEVFPRYQRQRPQPENGCRLRREQVRASTKGVEPSGTGPVSDRAEGFRRRTGRQKRNADGPGFGSLSTVMAFRRVPHQENLEFVPFTCISPGLVVVLRLCVVIAPRGLGSLFGRTKDRHSLAGDARNVARPRSCITSLDRRSGSGSS
jgi:hypothetical protein